ncbi:hypothetical protein C8R44DRAFT_973565, partial [Mycena epipterygia]
MWLLLAGVMLLHDGTMSEKTAAGRGGTAGRRAGGDTRSFAADPAICDVRSSARRRGAQVWTRCVFITSWALLRPSHLFPYRACEQPPNGYLGRGP